MTSKYGFLPYKGAHLSCIGNFYRPQTKFAKVMFSQVSVCPQEGGVFPIAYWDTPPQVHPKQVNPPGQVHPLVRYTPLARHPLWAGTPWAGTPWADTPLPIACWNTHTPPNCTVHAGIWSTRGRYTSHWNAFLLILLFTIMDSFEHVILCLPCCDNVIAMKSLCD